MYTPSQERALERMLSGESIYLSGAAGVGKSYLLNDFITKARDQGKSVMVTAPTGIAAINVGGSTVHSALGGPDLGKDVRAGDVLIETDILVVDEISMCRIDLFDHILKKLDAANIERIHQGKKKIQLVCVGDFAQLPPVAKKEDKEILDAFFPNTDGYAFEHPRWDLPTIQLTEVVRQRDSEFASALNQIRLGDLKGLDYINSHRSQEPIQDGIWVSSTNKKVQARNGEELSKLSGKRKTYEAITTGKYEEATDKQLTLANGCRVVSLVNQHGYSNGSLGTVLECGEGCVSVAFDNGVVADVGFHKWETKKPILEEKEDGSKHLSEKVIGTFEQLPLKLAYAVTVHKSQGQTYARMNADPYCFAPGQLYVELSRAQSIENLYLTRPILAKDLKTDPKVTKFYAGSDPVTVADVAFSIDDDDQGKDDKIVLEDPTSTKEDQEKDQCRDKDSANREDKKEEKTEVLDDSMPKINHSDDAIQSEPKPKKRRRKMNDDKAREVASDTITARVTPSTKEAYEKALESMPGDSKTEKFRNLVKAVGEADAIISKTGSDREDYETFLMHTTRIAESYSELLKKKSELGDQIRMEFQSELASKDKTIIDLQTKVAEKEDQIKRIFEEKKNLEDQIKSLELVEKEVETAKEKASSVEELLRDSRMICANLQEDIAKLKREVEGYDDLKAERDDLEKGKEKLSERLEEESAKVSAFKNEIEDLNEKLKSEKEEKEKERAEHLMELGRASKDAMEEQNSAVREARKEEKDYWQDQVEKIQRKLDQEHEKHAQEREELERLKLEIEFKINPKIATLEKENSEMKNRLEPIE